MPNAESGNISGLQLLTLSRTGQQKHPQVDNVKGMQTHLWQLPAQQAQCLLVCLTVNAEV